MNAGGRGGGRALHAGAARRQCALAVRAQQASRGGPLHCARRVAARRCMELEGAAASPPSHYARRVAARCHSPYDPAIPYPARR